ncbi:very-long-chain 3-oxoacyl-CoA reductase-like [Clavelina lepadiformis]|uniref:very-long-chain 3-oxoacyl-CoA reductase-like n=1 Tax=Clavelina lepadiformis TaxID=159417 RepID=UPI00404117E4
MDCSVFQCIGIFTSLYFIVKIVLKIIEGSRLYIFSTYPNFSKYGKWSVVTGSTDGIGKETAIQLASRGQNIVLISRNEEKLRNVAIEIESKHNVQTKCLTIDFSDDEEIYDKIANFLQGLDVGTLVNNVGISQEIACFHEYPNLSKFLGDIIRLNVISVIKMTQVVLPGMVKRKRGLVLNLSSLMAVKPVKKYAMYSATKKFVDYFAQALSYEYESKGITIQSCMPGTVLTNITKNYEELQKMPSPETYCKSWLATIGKARWTHGYWKHAIEGWIFSQIPTDLTQTIGEGRMDRIMELEKKKLN